MSATDPEGTFLRGGHGNRNMNRRRFLAAVGTVGLSVAAAGCPTDGDGESRDGASEPTGAGDATATEVDEPTVEERIASADAHLEAAAEELDAAVDEAGLSEGQAGEIDMGPIEKRLDRAGADLDAARGDATRDQRETIDALSGSVEFLRETTDVVVEFQGVVEAYIEVETHFEDEAWEGALDPLERADDRTSAAKVQLDEARTAFEGIDTDQLGGVSGVEAREMERTLEELEGVLAALDELITGLREAARGMGPFEAGAAAVEAEEWGRATDEFGVAVDRFSAAQGQFERAERRAPPELREGISPLVCQWSALREATEHFGQGTEAADQGDDEQAVAEFEAADRAVQQADQCGGS